MSADVVDDPLGCGELMPQAERERLATDAVSGCTSLRLSMA